MHNKNNSECKGDLFLLSFLNQTNNLNNLGKMFDKYPNLYADVSQRESYCCSDRKICKAVYGEVRRPIDIGTDQGHSLSMYRNSFRIWETLDEHFYAWNVSSTPWAFSGLKISDATLSELSRKRIANIKT